MPNGSSGLDGVFSLVVVAGAEEVVRGGLEDDGAAVGAGAAAEAGEGLGGAGWPFWAKGTQRRSWQTSAIEQSPSRSQLRAAETGGGDWGATAGAGAAALAELPGGVHIPLLQVSPAVQQSVWTTQGPQTPAVQT